MAPIHHFTYGAFNPVAAFLLAFLGSFFGLLCARRAREARSRGRRNRWLVIAAFAIGGGAIWLMHFAAMLGFDVPDSPVRYSIPLTALSFVSAVCTVGIGLMVVGHGRPTVPKIVTAGVMTGCGVLAMHYTGMAGLHVGGTIHYNVLLVGASAVIALVASTAALWFAVSVRGYGPTAGAAAIMAIAVCGMHYTGMAAMSVTLRPVTAGDLAGLTPLAMIVPITLLTTATIIGVALAALQAMTDEEFTHGGALPRGGVHAESISAWSLKQASLKQAPLQPASTQQASTATSHTMGSAPTSGSWSTGTRPSPRPVPLRSPSGGSGPVGN